VGKSNPQFWALRVFFNLAKEGNLPVGKNPVTLLPSNLLKLFVCVMQCTAALGFNILF
jgi:hypothetical protein